MTWFESLIREAVVLRQSGSAVSQTARAIGGLYQDASAGKQVEAALCDPFFPLTLYAGCRLPKPDPQKPRVAKAAQDLALLSRMHLRIRRDIDRYFGNQEVTCVDLNGDALQRVRGGGWCSLCGACCRLSGTVPDPPEPVRYPGYWYAYIAGDSPVSQRFCPFLFELPPRGLFFCAIHRVKPRTCLAFGREDCEEKYPGKARSISC